MDVNPRYTFVGIMVALILAALAVWITWLWNPSSKDKTSYYLINIRQQSLAGLQIDGIVSIRGLKVGSIKSIDIDSNDVESAWVKVAINNNIPVKQDTRAVITRNPLTGLSSIDLLGSTAASPLLTAASGSDLPVIAEGTGALDQAFQQAPELLAKATTAVEKLNLLLSDDNIKTISKIIDNAEKASEQLNPLMKDLQITITEMKGVASEAKGQVAPLLQELNKAATEARTAIQSVSGDIDQVSRAAVSAAQNLKEPRSSILGLPSGQYGPGEGN